MSESVHFSFFLKKRLIRATFTIKPAGVGEKGKNKNEKKLIALQTLNSYLFN